VVEGGNADDGEKSECIILSDKEETSPCRVGMALASSVAP
jgi:hypothetical protein